MWLGRQFQLERRTEIRNTLTQREEIYEVNRIRVRVKIQSDEKKIEYQIIVTSSFD